MPKWNRIVRNIADSIEAAAKEAKTKQQAQSSQTNHCSFWDCDLPIRRDHVLCYDHYQDFQEGLIDECAECKRAKYKEYELCLECSKRTPSRRASTSTQSNSRGNRSYKPEYSKAWEKGDSTADRFFVYILRLEGGRKFYAGQTRELRERLSEHRDGKVQSTAGKEPKLAWFGVVPSRQVATEMEVEFKKLIDTNEREIRRMIINFQDLIKEVELP